MPVARQIILELDGEENKSASVLLVTIWELGEAAGPLLIAPLSEVYGRYAIFNIANILFIFWTIVAALSQTSQIFILSRFLTGCAIASNVLNPAIVGDILPPKMRGSAIGIIMLMSLVGGAVGPAFAGFIAQSIGWRQILWISALLAGISELVFLLLLRETYTPTILKRRAAQYLKEHIEPSLNTDTKVVLETESSTRVIWRSIKRPATVLFDSFVLQILSLYGALIFTFFYILSTTLPDILHDIYHFPIASTGSSFLTFSVGSAFGITLCSLALDRIYVKMGTKNDGIAHPEYRMPLLIFSGFCLPAAVSLFGWTAQKQLHVGYLLFSVGLLGFLIILSMIPLLTYVTDAFGLYSASGLTAVLVTRCLMSTFLPLGVRPLVEAWGYGWGFTILAAACLAVAPIPAVVMMYGTRWRQLSIYTKDPFAIVNREEDLI